MEDNRSPEEKKKDIENSANIANELIGKKPSNINSNVVSNKEMIERLEEAKRNIEEYVSKGYDEPTYENTINKVNNTQSKAKTLVKKPGIYHWGFVNTVLLALTFVVSMLMTTVCIVFRLIS